FRDFLEEAGRRGQASGAANDGVPSRRERAERKGAGRKRCCRSLKFINNSCSAWRERRSRRASDTIGSGKLTDRLTRRRRFTAPSSLCTKPVGCAVAWATLSH